MKTQSIFSRGRLSAGVAPLVLGLAMISMPTFAQTAPATAEDEAATEGAEIVVTGSLITNPNLERSAPVLSTSSDEIELKQSNVAEEIIRTIPGVVPNIGSAVNNGNGGASFVDLRGLGSNRNIVLLDGARIVPSNFVGRVDLNNIPVALVERVDALTGAAVTTYGADAISGVVNFITKQNFQGAEISASTGITEKGDGNTNRIDLTVGGNFEDGRGNAVLSIGYQQSDPVFQGARKFSAVTIESLDKTNTAGAGSPTSTPSTFAIPGVGNRQIDANGNLVAPFQSFNFNPFNIFQTPFERFNIYGAARYEISDSVELYTRGLFSKNSVRTIIAPSGVFNSAVTINVNNPFLNASARNVFCARNDFNATLAGIQTISQAECDAAAAPGLAPGDAAYRQFTVNLRRRTPEVGTRDSDFQTTVFDYKAGIRGAITSTINYDLFGSYGESENTQTLLGYVSTTRTRQALLANNTTNCFNTANSCVPLNVFGPPGSITQAQANFLEVQSTTTNRTSLAVVRGTVSGDFGKAIPLAEDNVAFAVGGEYRKYKASQQADLLAQTPGELGGAGGAAPPVNGAYDVYEGFGELVAPLIQGKSGIEDLTLDAGVRYSSYKINAPGTPRFKTTTYKFGGSYTPIKDVKLRGNYSRAVRSPNIGELFSPQNTGLTNLANDPCQGAAPLNNANLRAVCLAQGAPAFTIGNILPPAAGQVNSTGGGNPNLRPEKADTYTAGIVLQPSFIPNLSLTVDYYNIKVKGAASAPTPNDAITNCFGASPTAPPASAATNPACLIIRRDPATGGLDGDPGTTPGLFQGTSNLGTLKTDGIDLAINYSRDLGFAKYTTSFVGNYTHDSKFKATPTSVNRECTGFYSVNCASIQPKFQFTTRTTLTFGDVDVSLQHRYIHKVKFEPFQQAADIAAADAANRDGMGVLLPPALQACPDFNGADPGGCIFDPEFRKIKSKSYFDLSTRISVSDNLTLTLLVENITNTKAPIVGNTIGSTTFNSGNTYPSTYDALGRSYTAAIRLKF